MDRAEALLTRSLKEAEAANDVAVTDI